LVHEAITISRKKCLIAGSFPPINVSFTPDLTRTKDELEDFYGSLGEIYKDNVDIIMCESMSSIFEGSNASTIAKEFSNRVRLSWTNTGHQPQQLPSTESLSKAVDFSIKSDVECTLINCSHADTASNSIEELKRASRFDIFANSSTFKEVDLSIATNDVDAIHHLNSQKISTKEYAMIALSWAKESAFVVGGCCGTTVEHTKQIKLLMDSL
jgi:Homocysteine/selenocysteine methylase (S-methylmethionine-dependent)